MWIRLSAFWLCQFGIGCLGKTVPAVAVIFGWPAVIASLVLLFVGVATGRSRLVFTGALTACPFLLYLFLTPRLLWVAPPIALLLFLAPGAVKRRQRRTAIIMVAPYIGVCAFVAYLVVNSDAG
jgi:hypothetical protein